MRPVFHGDIVAAARAIFPLSVRDRSLKLDDLLLKSARADAFRIATGRLNPSWGDGSLMAAALAEDPPPEPSLEDRDYCLCLGQVLAALAAR